MKQISNDVYCSDFLFELDIKTKLLPNPYNDLPFLIIDNFINKRICNAINHSIEKNDNFKKAKLRTIDKIIKSETNEEIRKTNLYKLEDTFLNIYKNSFKKAQEEIEGFFKLALIKSTEVQALEYLKDSFYSIHSDDSSMLFKDNKLVGFIPVSKERVLSTVLFTTDYNEKQTDKNSFYGGELVFNFLHDKDGNKIIIKPKAGQLVIFPSNPYFTHEVRKVKKGRRISLVQWHNVVMN